MKFLLFLWGWYYMQVLLWTGCETSNRKIDINVAILKSLEQFHNGVQFGENLGKQPRKASNNSRKKTTENLSEKSKNEAVNESNNKIRAKKDVPIEKSPRKNSRIKLKDVPPLNPACIPPKYDQRPPEKPPSQKWDTSKYPIDPETGEQIVYTPKRLKNSGRRNHLSFLPSQKVSQKKTSSRKDTPKIVNNPKPNSYREELQNKVENYPKNKIKNPKKINDAEFQNRIKEEVLSDVTQDEISLSGSVPLSDTDTSQSQNQNLKSGTDKNGGKIPNNFPHQNQNKERRNQNNIGKWKTIDPEFSSSVGSSPSVQKYSSDSAESNLREISETSIKKRNTFVRNTENKEGRPRSPIIENFRKESETLTKEQRENDRRPNPNNKKQNADIQKQNADVKKQNADVKKQNLDDIKSSTVDKEMTDSFVGERALAYLNMIFVMTSGRHLVKNNKGMILVQYKDHTELPIYNKRIIFKKIQEDQFPQMSDRRYLELQYAKLKSETMHWATNSLSFVNIRMVFKNYNWRAFCKIISHAIWIKTRHLAYYTSDEEYEETFYKIPANEYKLRPVIYRYVREVAPSYEVVTPCKTEKTSKTYGKILREIFYLSPGMAPGYFFVFMDFTPSFRPPGINPEFFINSLVVVDHLKLSIDDWNKLI